MIGGMSEVLCDLCWSCLNVEDESVQEEEGNAVMTRNCCDFS